VDHRSIDRGFTAYGGGLVVFTELPVLADPSESPLDDPPTRQKDDPFYSFSFRTISMV
jgi:hypothetical protein